MDFLLGATAACCAVCISNPFDVVKTRMQLQGELKTKGHYTKLYNNVFHALLSIRKNEGILALQKGLLPALAYQVALNGTRLGLFQTIVNAGWIAKKDGSSSTFGSILAGGAVGVVGGFTGNPLYLVKVQLQVQSKDINAIGHQHRHTGALSALSSIYSKNGILGLWRGSSASMLRAGIGSSAQLFTYTKSKDWLNHFDLYPKESWQSTFIAAFSSGFVVTTFMSPIDVISSRIFNQAVDQKGKGVVYSGVMNCLVKTIRTEGIIGLYKGWTSLYLRLGPHSFFNLLIWDQLKHLYSKLQEKDANTFDDGS